MAALTKEADPAMLRTLASKLDAASHHKTADVVTEKAVQISHGLHLTGQASISSRDVMLAQHRLRILGYDVPETGVLNPHTITAIKQFQSLYDLDIDGVLNPSTMAMLKAAAEGRI